MRYLVALFLVAVLGILQGESPLRASVYISGKAISSEANAPAAGLTLSLYTMDDPDNPVSVDQSLGNGSFLLKAPAAGAYRLAVQGPVFSRLEQTMDVPAAGLSSQVIHVIHLPSIRLLIQSADGKPVSQGPIGVWLFLARAGGMPGENGGRGPGRGGPLGPIELTQPVEADGRVEITLPEGIQEGIMGVVVRVRRPGLGCGQVQLDHWPRDEMEIHLQEGVTLQGAILDENGKPLAGASVTIAPVIGPGHARFRQGNGSIVTGPDGRFQTSTLLPGEYFVRARGPRGTVYIERVPVNGPTTTITLEPGGYTLGWPGPQARG